MIKLCIYSEKNSLADVFFILICGLALCAPNILAIDVAPRWLPLVQTTIVDTNGGPVTSNVGEQVKDTAVIKNLYHGIIPSGTLTYNFYTTAFPTYGITVPKTTETVTLIKGVVPPSTPTAALVPGSYSYIAVYNGDAAGYPAKVGIVEPITIKCATTIVNTKVTDWTKGSLTHLLGEKIIDTANITHLLNSTIPTGTLTYNFYTVSNPVYGTTIPSSSQTVTLVNGAVPDSSIKVAFAAGNYSFIAAYNGDATYCRTVGTIEPFMINKATPIVNTTIVDMNGAAVTHIRGERVKDTANLSNIPAASLPAGTFTYYFYNTSDPIFGITAPSATQAVTLVSGTVPNSNFSAYLSGGEYSYIGFYNGDTNYTSQIGAIEPLTIGPGDVSVTTIIVDQSGSAVTHVLGERVKDVAVVKNSSGLIAGGTLTYNFYMTATPIYGTSVPFTTQIVTLNSDGSVPISLSTMALAAGSYSYIAVYNGDYNCHSAIGSIEALTINKVTLNICTNIVDTVTNSAITQTVGESVKDTTTLLTYVTEFAPTGTLTYNFYTTSTPVYETTVPSTTETVPLGVNGYVPNSGATINLPAGSYSYIAYYNGDANYNCKTGPTESLTINKTVLHVCTTIVDAASGYSLTKVVGEKLTDTATLTNWFNAIPPSGTLTYNFYTTSSPVYGVTVPNTTETVTLVANGSVQHSAPTLSLPAGSYSYIAVYNGDWSYSSKIGPIEPLTISPGTPCVHTTIVDGSGGAVSNDLGERVQDTATVTVTSGFTPSGTLTYYFYTTATPVYGVTMPSTAETVTLGANGAVPNSSLTASLAVGGYSYIAIYHGGANNNPMVGPIEPLTINKTTPSVHTTIIDQNGGPVTNSLGEVVVDTAVLSHVTAGFAPTGTLMYNFYNTATPVYGTTVPLTTQTVTLAVNLMAPNSSRTKSLAAGSYSYIVVYEGDASNSNVVGSVEPLTIDKAQLCITTAIKKSADGSIVSENAHVALGTTIYDTAAVTGALAGFEPAGIISYTFQGVTDGIGLQSETHMPGASDTAYVFNAAVASDSNYIGATSDDEHFYVDKATLYLSTTMMNGTAQVFDGGGVPVGAMMRDEASLSGDIPGFAVTGEVNFALDGVPLTTNAAADAGSYATSENSFVSLAGPNHIFTYTASYKGNSNYNAIDSANNPETFIIQGPDLNISITSSQACNGRVENFVYTLSVTNKSGNADSGLVITDNIPSNASFVFASDGGTFDATSGLVTFPAFNLPAATIVMRTVVVSVVVPLDVLANPIAVFDSASVQDSGVNGVDDNPEDNTASINDAMSNLHFISGPTIDQAIVVGIPTMFSAIAQDDANPNATIDYTWDFGDGTTGTGSTTQHTYTTSGSYTISVIVSNGIGCPIGSAINRDTIGINNPPVVCKLLRVPFSLTSPNSDRLSLIAQIDLPAAFKTEGHILTVDIGNFSLTGLLNKNGLGIGLPRNENMMLRSRGALSLVSIKVTKAQLRQLVAPGISLNARSVDVPPERFLISIDLDQTGRSVGTFGGAVSLKYISNGKRGYISF